MRLAFERSNAFRRSPREEWLPSQVLAILFTQVYGMLETSRTHGVVPLRAGRARPCGSTKGQMWSEPTMTRAVRGGSVRTLLIETTSDGPRCFDGLEIRI